MRQKKWSRSSWTGRGCYEFIPEPGFNPRWCSSDQRGSTRARHVIFSVEDKRCKEHKCGGERKRSSEPDRELECSPGLFDGILVDEFSRHDAHNNYSEVGTSLTSSAYIEGLSQQRDRTMFDPAQDAHHVHITDQDQAQLSSILRETFQQYYQLYSCNSTVWQPGQHRVVV